MHSHAFIIALIEQRRHQCPCGAVADQPFGLCRKCQARDAWRRKTTFSRRKATRGRLGRRTRSAARFLVGVFTLFTAVSNGREG
jgi:hypothetical protein